MFVVELETKEIQCGEVITCKYLFEVSCINNDETNVIMIKKEGGKEVFPINNISKCEIHYDPYGKLYKDLESQARHNAWAASRCF